MGPHPCEDPRTPMLRENPTRAASLRGFPDWVKIVHSMSLSQVGGAVSTLAAFLAAHPHLEDAVRARWHAGGHPTGELPSEGADAADGMGGAVPGMRTEVHELRSTLALPGA